MNLNAKHLFAVNNFVSLGLTFLLLLILAPHLILVHLCVCPQVYAVGGYDGQSRLSSVECYDSFSNRWTEVAPMKEAVSSPAVASCAGKLFVIGGGPDDETCSDKVINCFSAPTHSST